MKLKLFASTMLLLLGSVSAKSYTKADIAVNSIQMGHMDEDLANEFSIQFNFTNKEDTFKKWQFGFYMPMPFYSLALQNVNQNLRMQICDAGGRCTNLRYVKADSITDKDLSQAYLTILEPISNFPLEEDKTYYIRLSHNNQGLPANISTFPQSLFLINTAKAADIPKIYTINTEISNYSLIGYDQNKIDEDLKNTIQSNWNSSIAANPNELKIVPAPVLVGQPIDSGYVFPKKLLIHNQLNSDNAMLQNWAEIIKDDLDKKVTVDNDGAAKDGILITEISTPKAINNNPEGYRITITADNIMIETMTNAGAYYALQTLRQLWYQNKEKLPSMSIVDYPRFKYRGILLDVARHYFSTDEIKKLIDVMAANKLNTLHLHLSDDEAFRLELASLPLLSATGANRGLGQQIGATMLIQNNLDTTNRSQLDYPLANTPYSGSYSPEDIKNLIAYANQNQITIIPEIDIPGHARSIIKAMPEVMIDHNDNSQYMSVQGYTDDVLPVCTYNSDISIGAEFTQTMNTLVNDIAKEFNGQTTIYAINNEISVAGDEVSKNAWSNDTSCRNEWSSLSSLAKSQLFLERLANNNSDLLVSGWQQLVQNPDGSFNKEIIGSGQTGHIWVWDPSSSGVKNAAKLATKNYPTVLAFADKTYFDLAYTPSMYEHGFTWAGNNNGSYTPLSSAITANETLSQTKNQQNILGLEGALWSENLASADHLFYMALPKLPALAEAAWSPAHTTSRETKLNWQSLANRLGCGTDGFLSYLNKIYQVNYRGYPNGINKEIPDGICKLNATSSIKK